MPRPNIVLVICHDLGRHLGCDGVSSVVSDNIDALAAEGVRMTNHFCTSPGCSPSRSSIMTGRYPHANGMMGLAHMGWSMHPGERHVAALMSEQGYDTELIGVQHVTMRPEKLGFRRVRADRLNCLEAAEVLCGLLRDRAKESAPFYVQLGLFEPHRPFDWGGAQPDDARGVWVPRYLLDCPGTRQELAAIQGAIRRVDQAMATVVRGLLETGLAENTILIFTTDHGIAFPRAKCTLYDAGIATTLILRWPAGGWSGGRTVDQLLSNVDLLPTLLEATSAPAPRNVQGRSFLALLQGRAYEPREEVFAEKTWHNGYDPCRAVRTGRYKFIANFDNTPIEVPTDIMRGPTYAAMAAGLARNHPPRELYDLKQDPDELENLAGCPELAEVERDLSARLGRWMRDTGDPLLEGPIPTPLFWQRIREFNE